MNVLLCLVLATDIAIDKAGVVKATGKGKAAGSGSGVGVTPVGGLGGSGGSHGGLGGQGSDAGYANPSVGNVLFPGAYGSGGAKMFTGQVCELTVYSSHTH